MSLPIWTPDALCSELRRLTGPAWRLVEAQHRVSTLPLVDDLAEQSVLEDILEQTKPPVPPECAHLDYLLATPFRYGSYPHNSRFRRAGPTPGVYYAAEAVETAVAETVFIRYLFQAESPGTPWPDGAAEYTGLAVDLAAQTIDLTAAPLSRDAVAWTHPTDYAPCHALADAAREAGAQMIRYESVRDPGQGANLAVLTCAAFAAPKPDRFQTWRIRIGPRVAQAICSHPDRRLEIPLAAFFEDPRLAPLSAPN